VEGTEENIGRGGKFEGQERTLAWAGESFMEARVSKMINENILAQKGENGGMIEP